MKIVVVGDSHSYGSELVPTRFRTNARPWFIESIPPEHRDEAIEHRKKHAWPGIFMDIIGLPRSDLINLSEPGAGNHRISMQLISWMAKATDDDKKNVFCLIGWSNPERFDVWSDVDQRWSAFFPGAPDENKSSGFYFKHIQSYKESYQRYFSQIIMMQHVLNKAGIGHAMFNAIVRPFGNKNVFEEFKDLVDISRIYPASMNDVCIEERCDRAPGHHFLEQGHRLWAEKMVGFVKTLHAGFNQAQI